MNDLEREYMERERIIDERGDGREYVEELDEEYENMTDEEKEEVEAIKNLLNEIMAASEQ